MRRLLIPTLLALMALPAFADDAAILLGVERYRNFDRLRGGAAVTDTKDAFARAGYTVDAIADSGIVGMREGLERFIFRSNDSDRLVFVMSGRFVTDENRSWLLAANAATPTLFDIERSGISVESALLALAHVPGRSVLVLGYDAADQERFDRSLREGIGALNIPQGVTVLLGEPRDVARAVADTILKPGEDIITGIRANPAVQLRGYRPRALVMQDRGRRGAVTPRPNNVDRAAEKALWDQTVRTDTIAGYRAFLSTYPDGAFVRDARAAINAINSEPNRAARLVEERLNLTRDQRRAIQRNLNLVGFGTRGIDGIFGDGTRTAITGWQRKNGVQQTSYLTGNQIRRLNDQGKVRFAEIQKQADAEREADLRRDRALWRQSGANGTQAGFRRYLAGFPDGLFSDEARAGLARIEQNLLEQANQQDRNLWRAAREQNSVAAYQSYLNTQRNGAFRQQAQARIAALQTAQADAPVRDRAIAAEAALRLNSVQMRLVQVRLQSLGFEVGRNDGRFDEQTRRAIRQFQRGRKLEVTGYLNEQSVVQLLKN